MLRKFVHYGFVLFFVTNAFVSAFSFALSDDEIRKQVDEMIGQLHPADTKDSWQALGSKAPQIIIQMYMETDHIYRQLRLLQALGWYDDPQAVEFIKSHANSTDNSTERIAAIKTLGISQGAKEIDFIQKFLEHSDPQTRLAAAQALQRIGTDETQKVLEDYRKKEKQDWVVKRLDGQLPVSVQTAAALVDKNKAEIEKLFAGNWKGLSLKVNATDFETQDVELSLSYDPKQIVKGTGFLKKVKFDFEKVEFKNKELTGRLKIKSEVYSFRAFREEDSSVNVLELRLQNPWQHWVLRQQKKDLNGTDQEIKKTR